MADAMTKDTGATEATTQDHIRRLIGALRIQGARLSVELAEAPFYGTSYFGPDVCEAVADALTAAPQPADAPHYDFGKLLDTIRSHGWVVAVHNDYRLNGEAHTFWLFTKDGRAVKGEGRTDGEALARVVAAVHEVEFPSNQAESN